MVELAGDAHALDRGGELQKRSRDPLRDPKAEGGRDGAHHERERDVPSAQRVEHVMCFRQIASDLHGAATGDRNREDAEVDLVGRDIA